MYSSDGTDVFEIGANLTSLAVSGQVTLTNIISANGSLGTAGQALLTDGSSKVYWGSVSSGSAAVRTDYIYTANEGQTTFSGLDDDGDTLSLGSTFDVFLNGSLISPSGNYTSNSTAIVFTDSTGNNDIITVRNIETVAGELRNTYVYTANEGQTVFTGSDDNSATLSMTNYKDVFINGVLITDTTDNFTANDTHITFTGGVSNNDIVTIKSYDTVAEFSSIDDNGSSTAITIDSGGNVGIGTASPARDLHVATADAIAARFQHTDGASMTIELMNNGSSPTHPFIGSSGQSVILGASGVTDFSVTSSGNFEASNAAGPALLNEAAVFNNPTIVPRKTDTATGWGSGGANNIDGVIGGTRTVNFGAGATAFYNSSGNEVARIDRSSGNVGIGTSSPSSALNGSLKALEVSSAVGSAIRATDTAASTNIEIAAGVGATYVWNTTNTPMRFGTNNAERMRIDSSGNVGIGTSSVSSATKLEVYGNSAAAHVGIRANNAAADGYATLWLSNAGDNTGIIRGGASAAAYTNQLAMLTGSAMPITFSPNNTEAMRIDSSGNVGIGVTPTYKLEIGGVTESIFRNTGGSVQSVVYSSGGGSQAQFGTFSAHPTVLITSGTERMRITSSGDVAVGRTSGVGGAKVTVETGVSTPAVLGYGDRTWLNAYDPNSGGTPVDLRLWAYGNSNATNDAYVGTWSAHPLKFATGGSIRATIDTSGNVGIGTSSPSYLTHLYSTSAEPKLVIEDASSGAGRGGIVTGSWGGNGIRLDSLGAAGWVYVGGGNTSYIPFTIGTEKARFHSNGYFGIGTSSPSRPLHISASDCRIRLTDSDAPTISVELMNSSGSGILATNGASSLLFQTDNAERMRIDSSGNVGIGTSSPAQKLSVESTGGASSEIDISLVSGISNKECILNFGKNLATADRYLGRIFYQVDNNVMGFWTSNAERMRITSSGSLLVGQTSSASPGFNNTIAGGAWSADGTSLHLSRSSNGCAWFNRSTTTGSVQSFRYNGSAVGSISVTASTTAYNTSSDYRLKENVVNLSGAIDRVKLLKPSRFNFIADPDTTVDGFVAHEVSDVVPEAICGEKDAVDAEGNPEYQGIDQSKLVPVLTAALQEALTKIEALEARIVALETT
jgi:hypothetical protein